MLKEEQQIVQEEATKARTEFKKKWNRRANIFLAVWLILGVVIWYVVYGK